MLTTVANAQKANQTGQVSNREKRETQWPESTNLANKEYRTLSYHDPFKIHVDFSVKAATAARFPPKKINPLAYHPYYARACLIP